MEQTTETTVNSEALNPYDQLLADLAGENEVSAEPAPAPAPEVISDQPAIAPQGGPTLTGTIAPQTVSTGAQSGAIPSAEEIIESMAQSAPNAAEQPSQASEEAPEAEASESSTEIPDFNSEEFMDSFYDNPAEAVEKAANAIAEKKVREAVSGIEQRLKPLLDESEAAKMKSEIKAVISDFVNTNDGAQDMFPDIANYIKANNLNPRDRRSYEDGYKEAIINKLKNENESLRANQGRSLDDYLGDESSLEKMANNERVSKMAIENYLKTLQNGNKPAVIGGNSSAAPSAQPVNNPKSLKDAGAMLRSALSKN